MTPENIDNGENNLEDVKSRFLAQQTQILDAILSLSMEDEVSIDILSFASPGINNWRAAAEHMFHFIKTGLFLDFEGVISSTPGVIFARPVFATFIKKVTNGAIQEDEVLQMGLLFLVRRQEELNSDRGDQSLQ